MYLHNMFMCSLCLGIHVELELVIGWVLFVGKSCFLEGIFVVFLTNLFNLFKLIEIKTINYINEMILLFAE